MLAQQLLASLPIGCHSLSRRNSQHEGSALIMFGTHDDLDEN
jgi:hypothetical protein